MVSEEITMRVVSENEKEMNKYYKNYQEMLEEWKEKSDPGFKNKYSLRKNKDKLTMYVRMLTVKDDSK